MSTPMMSPWGPQGLLPVLVLGVLGLTAVLIAVPATLAHQWRMLRVAQAHILLKREMVQRGMSAGEIERVIRATSVPELVQQGLSVKAIERLLRANGPSEAGDGDLIAAGRYPAKGAPPDPEV
jgi:hypothetical protein